MAAQNAVLFKALISCYESDQPPSPDTLCSDTSTANESLTHFLLLFCYLLQFFYQHLRSPVLNQTYNNIYTFIAYNVGWGYLGMVS